MERLTKRQIQAINTKNKIYNIATNLMQKEGYDNITIQNICEKAEVSVGSFYHYFESKNDILIELYKKADHFFL
ncbi:TetR/AcrR family transcriptional regulator [Clostridium botulinum]|uniref:TetR/AcrR family transcriptional regulator n=1 Tax=Clostridium botulinum TaxID=1491 RepID=UPI00217DA990|nr:TetR/AcrR family transcriptional regulator [Clostridium botulinum]